MGVDSGRFRGHLIRPDPCYDGRGGRRCQQRRTRWHRRLASSPGVPIAVHGCQPWPRSSLFLATGLYPAHTSQASGRNTENLRNAKRAELPYTPLEWLTCAAPRSHAFPRLPSPPDLMGLTTRLQLMVGGWQQWEVCRFPRQHPSCRSHSSYCKAL